MMTQSQEFKEINGLGALFILLLDTLWLYLRFMEKRNDPANGKEWCKNKLAALCWQPSRLPSK